MHEKLTALRELEAYTYNLNSNSLSAITTHYINGMQLITNEQPDYVHEETANEFENKVCALTRGGSVLVFLLFLSRFPFT